MILIQTTEFSCGLLHSIIVTLNEQYAIYTNLKKIISQSFSILLCKMVLIKIIPYVVTTMKIKWDMSAEYLAQNKCSIRVTIFLSSPSLEIPCSLQCSLTVPLSWCIGKYYSPMMTASLNFHPTDYLYN
jgi:hypothetical protein